MLFMDSLDEDGMIRMRAEDAGAPLGALNGQTKENYRAFYDALFKPCEAPGMVSFTYEPMGTGPIPHLPQAAGITLVTKYPAAQPGQIRQNHEPPAHPAGYSVMQATTRGVGEMILDALNRGCKTFLIGIGGSATNDGGVGILKALGFRFTDDHGQDVGEGAQALGKICRIECCSADPRLSGCRFRIACDVENPLCGPKGATYIFGPQKGVAEDQKEPIDRDMSHFADVTAMTLNKDCRDAAGAGAAGGLGFAFLSYLKGELTPGIDLVLDAVGLEKKLADADIVVTGEGRLDAQTAMGKAPVGVARLAKRYGTKVIAFAGSVTSGARACNKAGIDAYFPILRSICTLEDAMNPEQARQNLADTAEQVFRLL
ncbi:MAG: glycerate kinase [Lachnospiraceae bacterium]|nr:glycerate kinase [Lachnospiraceae bacterium]